MNKYQEECRIIIQYPDGREVELLGEEKEAYWKDFAEKYKNHPMSSGLFINPQQVTVTGIWTTLDHVMFQHLPDEYAKCDYCGIFQVRETPFSGYCRRCGAPLPKSLTFT